MKKSVILLGPTGVGKSFLSTKLEEKNLGDYDIISTDNLYTTAILVYNGGLSDFAAFENQIRSFAASTRVNPQLPYYFERLQKQSADADKYFARIKRYLEIADFGAMSAYVEALAYLDKFKSTEMFSAEGFAYRRSLLFSKMIERGLANIKKPIILDAGSNFGSDATATANEKDNFRHIMSVDYDLNTYMSEFVKGFGTRIYFDTNGTYKLNPYSKQRLSKIHFKTGNGYKDLATDSIDVSKFYNGYNEQLCNMQRRVLDTDIDLMRLEYINQKEADRLVEELVELIKNRAKKFE